MEVVKQSLQWESERISLIKKSCHEYDEEWRMVCPFHSMNRPCIKSVVLGLRMPEYKKTIGYFGCSGSRALGDKRNVHK